MKVNAKSQSFWIISVGPFFLKCSISECIFTPMIGSYLIIYIGFPQI